MSKVYNNYTKDDSSTTYKTKSCSKSIFIRKKNIRNKKKKK